MRVEEVRVADEPGADLRGAALMHPAQGQTARGWLHLHGWVLGGASRALAIEVTQGDAVARVAPVRLPSPVVEAAHPQAPGSTHCRFTTAIRTNAIDPDRPLVLLAVLADGRRTPMATISLEPDTAPQARRTSGSPRDAPDLSPRIERIARDLAAAVAADSERVPPEAALLAPPGDPAGDSRLPGLDSVDLSGRRVLDLASRAGHLARAARARGAALVDGIEEDERLLVLARVLNARHNTTRVSFWPALGGVHGRYDVVIAPAPGDAGPAADAVARLTDGVLLAPAGQALEDFRRAFPVQRKLAPNGLIALAHDEEALPA